MTKRRIWWGSSSALAGLVVRDGVRQERGAGSAARRIRGRARHHRTVLRRHDEYLRVREGGRTVPPRRRAFRASRGWANGCRSPSGTALIVDLTDTPDPGADDYVGYTYTEYLACFGYHLIHRQLQDGESYLLVQAETGARIDLLGVPVLAHDCGRLAVVSGLPSTRIPCCRSGGGTKAVGPRSNGATSPSRPWTPGTVVVEDHDAVERALRHRGRPRDETDVHGPSVLRRVESGPAGGWSQP